MNDDRWNSYGNTSGNGQYRDDNTSSKDQAYQEYLRLRENRSSRSSDRSRHIKDDSLYGEYYAGSSRKKRSSGEQYVDGTYYYERSGRHRQAVPDSRRWTSADSTRRSGARLSASI